MVNTVGKLGEKNGAKGAHGKFFIKGAREFFHSDHEKCGKFVDMFTSLVPQKIADEHEPMASAVYVRGSAVEQELRGKKLSAVPWESYQNLQPWSAKIFEAYGFPKADAQR